MSREDMKHIDDFENIVPNKFEMIKKAFAKTKDSNGSVFSIDATRIKDTSTTFTRETLLQALSTVDETGENAKTLVQASRWLYKRSGEYRQLIHRFAGLHLYRYVVFPKLVLDEKNIIDEYDALSNYCLNADIEQTCNDIVIRALIDGSAYTYETIDSDGSVITQFLPADYCRSRTFDKYGNRIVEMNFKYFDDKFSDVTQRELVLSQLPEEFKSLYANCTNRKSNIGDDRNYQWQQLDPRYSRATCFSLDGSPFFCAMFPDLIDYMEYKEMNKLSSELDLFTILVQKAELDNDGNITVDEDTMDTLISTLAKIAKSGGCGSFTTPYAVEALRVKDSKEKDVDYIQSGLTSVYNSASLPEVIMNSNSKNGGSVGVNSSNHMTGGIFTTVLAQFRRWYVMRFMEISPSIIFDIEFLPITKFNEKDISTQYKDALSMGGSWFYYSASIGINQFKFARINSLEEKLCVKDTLRPPQTSYTTNNETSESGRPTKNPEDRSDTTNTQIDKGIDKSRAKKK